MSFLTIIFWIMVFIIWTLVGFLMMTLDAISPRSRRESSTLKKILMFPAEQIVALVLKRR